MPEGPEALINAHYIKKRFKGWTFSNIESNTKTKRTLPSTKRSSDGLVVIDAYSYGKIIIIQVMSHYVHIHLGITGWIVPKKPRIYKYGLSFSKETKEGVVSKTVYIEDRRRFSSINIYSKADHLTAISGLGTDILSNEFTLEYVSKIITSKKRNICATLMDQGLFAGLGNYIKNDALYLARISPLRKCHEIDKAEIKKLYESIRWIAFSNVVDWFDKYNIKIPTTLMKVAPKKLLVPYIFFVFDREKDDFGNNVVFLKSCGGRRTFYVPALQK